MAGTKTLIFEPSNLYALLVHYTDGMVPLNGEVQDVLVHPKLSRMVALNVLSQEWQTEEPLHLRYEGKRTMSWTKDQEMAEWAQREDTPKRQ
jgi:hypothetical protein